ncbi:hypothetical protein Zmor_019722 [Zophobas morio]|uniref:Uncharacterized protein n=1 Tax=Zophobas morio TaxID=2755281 RepID=A0AA38M8M8_9CUCU|nr:hypothetical protein Zmor_019722 [Zophobas morio]
MPIREILEGDPLLVLTYLSIILSVNRVGRKISYFYYAFLVTTVSVDILVISVNKEWNLLFGQYLAFIGGLPVVFACYATACHRSYVNMIWNIYNETFPFLWPL